MIKCPNPECQTINPEGNQHCTSCQTVLPHRYLWVVSQQEFDPAYLEQRYSWKHQQIILDTEPGLPPPSPEPIPPHILPYLALAPHGLHIPQPYALLRQDSGQEMLLLENAAIASAPGESTPSLLPSLKEAWPTASPLRQINWLWQIAQLWPDFIEQQVASSLLLSTHLRVHGSLVRLLELSPDEQPLTLVNLGKVWQMLVAQAQPSIEDFLTSLCAQLVRGEISTPEVLLACLDEAIASAATGYQVDYELAVLTDRGPSRKRNEDACYPSSGTTQSHSVGAKVNRKHKSPLLLMVCDGIGGHEGGDVASQVAIATIKQELAPVLEWLADAPLHDSATVALAIEQAISEANDNISQHNDQGQRQARDRMGTTLVMALIVGVHIYIAHVGDSRAYRISANSCRQITFDDDVAAREVRLGYSFYADAIHRPGTGALIQALGMGHSTALHVSVQRLILDEDIVLLLCSDGLSDYDRVEQNWQTHLLPIMTGQLKPSKATTGLVKLANTYNGHDNITVGVVASHIQALKPTTVPRPLPSQSVPSPEPAPATVEKSPPTTVVAQPSPPPVQTPKASWTIWPIFLSLMGFLGAATAITLVFFREDPVTVSPNPASSLPESIQNQPDAGSVGIVDNQPTPSLMPGSELQLLSPVSLLTTIPQLDSSDRDATQIPTQVPDGTIVQVITRLGPAAEQSLWVKLKTCTVDSENQLTRQSGLSSDGPDQAVADSTVTSPTETSLTSSSEGWVLAAELAPIVRPAEGRNCPSE